MFLFSLSKVCRISSADGFISGFTASQSTLFCKAKYSVLHFAHKPPVLLRICFQSFSLRHALKNTLEKNIFNLCPTSFFCLLHFIFFAIFVLTSPRKTNYLSTIIGKFQSLCGGVLQKFFTPTIIGKLQAVCWGVLRKFYKKNCQEIFPTIRMQKGSPILLKLPFSIIIYVCNSFSPIKSRVPIYRITSLLSNSCKFR